MNSPPYFKNRIPDFSVSEGCINNTMKDIDLFMVFGDPDLPPAGNDSLNFSVDASQFPATITDDKLTFGVAPNFPGNENHIVNVTVTATDRGGLSASLIVNITVIQFNRPPDDYWKTIEILGNEVSYFDLHNMFIDPDGDPLNFTYLGGATDNLTVEVAPNGSAVFRPAPSYYTVQVVLRFKAADPMGANRTGELVVRIRPGYSPIPQPAQIPDSDMEIKVNESGNMTFSVFWLDWIGPGPGPNLSFAWYIDEILQVRFGAWNYTWRTSANDIGPHNVRCRVSDNLSFVDAIWNFTVVHVNRPPVIIEILPPNYTVVKHNSKITFRATANDADGDTLAFQWSEDGYVLRTDSGQNTSMFKTTLPGGSHLIRLVVEDGQGGSANMTIVILVYAKPEPELTIQMKDPWEVAVQVSIITILLIVSLVIIDRRLKKR